MIKLILLLLLLGLTRFSVEGIWQLSRKWFAIIYRFFLPLQLIFRWFRGDIQILIFLWNGLFVQIYSI